MLRVINLGSEIDPGIVEVDFYVPLTISYEDNRAIDELPRTFSLRGSDSSMVEFIVNPASGVINEIVIVSVHNNCFRSVFPPLADRQATRRGNPIVEISGFEQNGVKVEARELEFDLMDRFLSIKCQAVPAVEVVQFPPVDLYLDGHGEIVGLRFGPFSLEDWSELTDGIKHSSSSLGRRRPPARTKE